MTQSYVLPRPGQTPDAAWAARLVDVLQMALTDISRAAKVGIVTANVTPPATFDPTTATLPQTAQAVATLIAALRTAGRTT